MVPMAPLTKPTSTHRLLVSITQAECARNMTGSSPAASSAGALDAFAPVWTAWMVAIGSPLARSLETLCSTTASTVGWRWRASATG